MTTPAKTPRTIAEDKSGIPPQSQSKRPGETEPMSPEPADKMETYRASGKFEGKVAVVTGGDSGIGRATAIGFAKEGARVVLVYLDEHDDAKETKRLIEDAGGEALLMSGDIGDKSFTEEVIEKTIDAFGRIDVLFNNAAEQHPQKSITDITEEQLEKTFRTNIFSMFFLVQAALPYLKEGSSIINTTSVTAYKGSEELLDYSATKGTIVAFTRSLSLSLSEKKIRVNAVAPGPIWTPLIPSTFDLEKVDSFGEDTPMGRAGQPDEVATAVLFLASEGASYISGQVIHPNGGRVVNG